MVCDETPSSVNDAKRTLPECCENHNLFLCDGTRSSYVQTAAGAFAVLAAVGSLTPVVGPAVGAIVGVASGIK